MHQVYSKFEGNLDEIFRDPKTLSFFVGAGISIDNPSNLLPASQFTQHLLDLCTIPEEKSNLLSIDTLRYEMIVEMIQKYIDYDLEFMDYFDNFTQPNFLHLFLAQVIRHGSLVFTTNFDYLIEHALVTIIQPKEHENILPIITTREFKRYGGENFEAVSKRHRLFKLHGAKRNLITNIKTTESLMTTLSSFGKGDSVLTLDLAKRATVEKAVQDNTLVIMGYSGSDDFDIAPMLRQLFNLKRLVWIEHTNAENTEIVEFDPKKSFTIPEGLTRSEQLLAQICSNTEAQVLMIKTNTQKFIQDYMWDKMFSRELLTDTKAYLQLALPSIIPLDKFLNEKFTRIPVELKWKISADLYYELGYHTDFLRTAQKGLEVAKEANSSKLQSEFLNLLGIYNHSQKKYDLALQYYQDSLKMAESGGHRYLKGSRLNNIGMVYYEEQKYPEALKYFEDALQLGLERGDHLGIAARHGNIGLIYLAQKEYEKAEERFEKAFKIDEKIGNLIGRSIRLKSFGDLYQAKGNNGEALEYYRKSYRILQKLGDLRRTGQILVDISKLQLKMGDLSKAMMNIKLALKYFRGAEDPMLLEEAQSTLASIKSNLN